MMRLSRRGLRDPGLLALLGTLALLAMPIAPARAQTAITRDDVIAKLNHYETDAEIDVPALRQQVAERSKSRSKNEPPPSKRPPIAPDLTKLPTFNVDIAFDVDTPIVLPESYQTVGRIADALTHSSLLPYTFLIVGHIESTGRRENNVLLSQRRADAIRDILVNTFKITPKRLQSVGLGEEQLLDPAKPNAPVNNQVQIMLVAKLADSAPPAHPAPAAAAKKPAKSAKKH
ncbi:OmpA family protein [Bradyrhizobium elkanii]|jgi:outer membrane protein OmpA-like peptidoglycan-associated protein|uniref:OmpA family protein n=2 Tax=Bradyrhizobium TaxID=374 RepID=UPI000486FFC3